jgi:hypothetical protein
MKRWRFVVLIVTLVLATLSMPSSSMAAETHELSFKGHIVEAHFSTSEGACVITNVGVQAAEGTFDDESGRPAFFGKAAVSLFQVNVCEQAVLLGAGGIVPFDDPAFQADNQLNSARLNTTARVCTDEPRSCFDVSINLTWMGVGETTRTEAQSRITSRVCRMQKHEDVVGRSAIVSGSISSDVFSLNPAVTGSGSLALARNVRTVATGEDCESVGGVPAGAFPI